MKVKLLNFENTKSETIEVSDKILKNKINYKLIKSVIDWQLNHLKPRTAKTKQKNEIKGSTKKIVPQKGSGGARHASRKAPIFVGGGVAHGPKGENAYKTRKLNKKEKKIGLSSMISKKNTQKDLLVFSDFQKEINKTKEIFKILKKFDATNSLIVLDKNSNDKIGKSLRNLPHVKVTDITNISIYDLVKYRKLILTETSIKELEKRFL